MWPLRRKRARGRADPVRWGRVLRATAVGWALVALAAGSLSLVYDGHLARAGRVAVAVAGHASAAAGLVVRKVYVTGRVRSDEGRIVAALALRQGDPILIFDLAAARTRLLALPWIKAATVRRLLPGTVEVAIVEREPLALWRRGKGRTLIDRDGMPIRVRDLHPWRHLLVVQGDDAATQAAALIDALRANPGLYEQVLSARRVGGRRWDLTLAGGIAVHLPEDAVEAAWLQLAALVAEQGLLQRDIVAVDLRLPDRLVVRLSPPAAARRRDPGKQT